MTWFWLQEQKVLGQLEINTTEYGWTTNQVKSKYSEIGGHGSAIYTGSNSVQAQNILFISKFIKKLYLQLMNDTS